MASGLQCFGCGEMRYRHSDCKNQKEKKTLLVDPEDYEESDAEIRDEPEFETSDMIVEEELKGDGPLLEV